MKERLSILRNAMISSLGTYAEYGLGLAASIWIARSLGPTEFGHYAFVIWVCGWLLIASNNALTMSSIKFLAEARGRGDVNAAQVISGYLLRLQARSTAVVLMLFLIVVAIWRPVDWTQTSAWIIPMIVLAVLARAGFAMHVAIAKGFERFVPEAVSVIAVGAIGLVLVIYAASLQSNFSVYVSIYVFSSVALYLVVRLILRIQGVVSKAGELEPIVRKRLQRHLMSTGLMIVLLSMSARTIETLMLKVTATAAAVGFFAISATLAKGAVDVLASGLSATLLPAMARAYGRSKNLGSSMLPDSIRYFAFLGFALAGGGYALAPAVVHLLYGNRFDEAIVATQISLLVAGGSLLVAPINAYQTTSDLQDDRVRVAAITLFVNLIVGLLLIPHWGLAGALATHATARLTYIATAIGFLQIRLPIRFPTRQISTMAAAAAASFLFAIGIRHVFNGLASSAVAAGVAFTLAYLSLTVATRCWNRADYRLLEQLVKQLRLPARISLITTAIARRFSFEADR